MKKYFIKETDEELEFGDIVELDLFKETSSKSVNHTVEVKFTEDIANLLVDAGIVEEREDEDTPHRISFLDDDVTGECERSYFSLMNYVELLDKRLKRLESYIGDFTSEIDELNDALDDILEPSLKKHSNVKKKNKYDSGKK